MSDLYTVKEKMHKMRAKLYPSSLPGSEGKYVARTVNEGSVTISDICASMKNRAGYKGTHEDAKLTLHQFFTEMMYQLADGFSVNLGFCSIHPNIGGLFTSEKDVHDHELHPLTFRFQELKPMRDLRELIEVIIEGIADTFGFVEEFCDIATGALNESMTPMNLFVITGERLKVAGDHPDIGVYFEQQDGPAKLKVTALAENTPGKLIGLIPAGPAGKYKVVIRTQHTSSPGKFLKELKVIESRFTLTR
ncbi:MAG: DUF4469 domain-containing protein [Treponema sp.]|nr:DUF4469 domain-containing protein [Treponema sp.]